MTICIIWSSDEPWEKGPIIIPILQMSKLRLGDSQELAQLSHAPSTWVRDLHKFGTYILNYNSTMFHLFHNVADILLE